jgi:hypothetical protein
MELTRHVIAGQIHSVGDGIIAVSFRPEPQEWSHRLLGYAMLAAAVACRMKSATWGEVLELAQAIRSVDGGASMTRTAWTTDLLFHCADDLKSCTCGHLPQSLEQASETGEGTSPTRPAHRNEHGPLVRPPDRAGDAEMLQRSVVGPAEHEAVDAVDRP